jgi:hypothetical protein
MHRNRPLAALGLLLALAGMLWLAAAWLLPSQAQLAQRLADAAGTQLGVPVSIGTLRWRLLPTPALTLEDLRTAQPRPLVIHRLTLYPRLDRLLQRRLAFRLAEVQGAVLPHRSLRELGATPPPDAAAPSWALDAVPLERIVFSGITWRDRRDLENDYEGEADFGPGWRPAHALLRRTGAQPEARLELTREAGEADGAEHWQVHIAVGGGTGHGRLALRTRAGGGLRLDAQLEPRAIDLASALAAFKRRSAVEGRVSGHTVLWAEAPTLAGLGGALHTRTRFEMGPATVLRFDLQKAIRSFGKEHDGQTPLETLQGQLDTQNTPEGMVATYTGVKARSGAFTASGEATLLNRRIEARAAVDLVDGLVGVPVQVAGTLDALQVSVPRGALIGAAIGTLLLPGIGTAIGARLGGGAGGIAAPGPARGSAPQAAARPPASRPR